MRFTIGLPITKSVFLKETLESIALQSYGEYELIIRNNAQTRELKDEIKGICSAWLEKPNVIYSESEGQLPIADNFNKLVEIANGDYFTIISDDDVLHPDFLHEFDGLITKYEDTDVFHCRVRIVNQDMELLHYSELCPEYESLPDFLYHRLINVRRIFLSDFVVRTSVLKKIGGFPVKSKGWGVDTLTWHLMGDNGFGFTPKALLDYRVNSANFTNNTNNLIVKLNDLVYLKDQKEKIIQKESFKKESEYPENFLMEKLEERFTEDSREIFGDLCKANSLPKIWKYYKQFKEQNNLNKKVLLKQLMRKYLSN